MGPKTRHCSRNEAGQMNQRGNKMSRKVLETTFKSIQKQDAVELLAIGPSNPRT